MESTNLSLEKNFYINIIEEAYYRKAWHGPNLHSSLKGVTAKAALIRPAEERHNIYEITAHAAYWVYRVIKRIRKDSIMKFPIKGTNWYESPDILTEAEWRKLKNLLNTFHDELYNLIKELNKKEFSGKPEKEKRIIRRLVVGIVMHDVYHAGQIQLIKKLIKI